MVPLAPHRHLNLARAAQTGHLHPPLHLLPTPSPMWLRQGTTVPGFCLTPLLNHNKPNPVPR